MRQMILIGICAIYWAATISAVVAGETIAIIPGKDAAAGDEAVQAVLADALGRHPGVRLVEREKIAALLAEQELGLSALGDASAVAKAGKVVAADMFIFLEKSAQLDKSVEPRIRQVIVESRTGVVLDDRVVGRDAALQDVKTLLAGFEAAARTAAIPQDKRRFVGVLAFRNAESGTTLDGLASALQSFVTLDLRTLEGVCVLDRRRLRQLTEEKNLTEFDQRLKTSAVLLEGSIRRGPGAGTLVTTLVVRPLVGGAPRMIEFEGRREAPRELRREVVRRLAQAITDQPINPGAAPAMKPEIEAEAFATLGESHARHHMWMEAVAAMDAAVALSPTYENKMRLLRVLPRQPDDELGQDRGEVFVRRNAELLRDLCTDAAGKVKAGGSMTPPFLSRGWVDRSPEIWRGEKEKKLLLDATRTELDGVEAMLDAYRDRSTRFYVESLMRAIGDAEIVMPPEAWIAYLRRRVEECEGVIARNPGGFGVHRTLFGLKRSRGWDTPEEKKRYETEAATWEWMTKRSEPFIRAAGYATIVGLWYARLNRRSDYGVALPTEPLSAREETEAIAAGAAALRSFLIEIPKIPGSAWRDFGTYGGQTDLGAPAVNVLSIRNDSWDKHIFPAIRQSLADEQPSTAESVGVVLRMWTAYASDRATNKPDAEKLRLRQEQVRAVLEGPLSPRAAAELAPYRKMLLPNAPATVTTWTPPTVKGEVTRLSEELRYRSDPRGPLTANPWRAYELREIKGALTPPVKDAGIGGTLVDAEGITALWNHIQFPPGCDPDDHMTAMLSEKTRSTFWVQRITRDGQTKIVGKIELPAFAHFPNSSDYTFPIILGDAIFFLIETHKKSGNPEMPDSLHTLVMIRPDTSRWLTEAQGLPGPSINGVASLGDGLILTLQGGPSGSASALAFYSPKANRFDLIASSRASGNRTPLDGAGTFGLAASTASKNAVEFHVETRNRRELNGWWKVSVKPGAVTDKPAAAGDSNLVLERMPAQRVATNPEDAGYPLDGEMSLTKSMELRRYKPRSESIAPLPPVEGGSIGVYTLIWENAPKVEDQRMAASCIGRSGEGLILLEDRNYRMWVLVHREKLKTVTMAVNEQNMLPK